ncbi:hypothetical protein PQQ53_03930 [Paraburkholderia strydomiana]|uniref:Uncharacterized protein n=1 Tax=Paraburkholderia strydomiana TaxID=1245417 RepID=A0ABW9E8S5_9BURK
MANASVFNVGSHDEPHTLLRSLPLISIHDARRHANGAASVCHQEEMDMRQYASSRWGTWPAVQKRQSHPMR